MGKMTVECYCGYIGTFEIPEFTCPYCGRKYQRTQGKNAGKIIQTKTPNKCYTKLKNRIAPR